jgi:hypothetical protein
MASFENFSEKNILFNTFKWKLFLVNLEEET